MSQLTPEQGTGLTRRRTRISDEETAKRMLRAALAMVEEAGLTVSLEHISFEDVIRDAGVSRSAVYRRWPYKDLFFSDLLRELAKGSSPAIAQDNQAAIEAVNRIILERLDWLEKPGLRLALAAEVLRQGALREFEIFHESAQWRTYFALHATFRSVQDGALREEVQSALAGSEQVLITNVANAYQRVTTTIGLRIRDTLDTGFTTLASLVSATIRGLVLMAPANPGIVTERFRANPFGAPRAEEWSQPALGMASVAMTFIEADPDIEWTADHIESVRAELSAGAG